MSGLVYAMVFLLNTVLAAVGVVLSLSLDPAAPQGSSLLGTMPPLGGGPVSGVYVLKMTRGTGQALRTVFAGHWLVSQS